MSKAKGRAVATCIMLLLSAVLYAIVRFKPDTLVIVLGVFAIPGFIACWILLYQWLMLPEGAGKRTEIVSKRF